MNFANRPQPYELLVKEFEPSGELEEHVMLAGHQKGEINFKQKWKHSHSGYEYTWHQIFGKKTFVRDKIWKAARYIRDKKWLGYKQIQLIIDYKEKPLF